MSGAFVCVVGNLTKDPETKEIGTTSLTEFSVAVNRHEKSREGGGYVDVTDYYDCKIWGKRGENAAKYLFKGTSVFINGEMEHHKWPDRDTQTTRMKVVINNATWNFAGPKQHGNQQVRSAGEAEQQYQGSNQGSTPNPWA